MASIEQLNECAASFITPHETAAFAFDIANTVCFAALVITFISSEKLRATRHPVLINLFATLLLYSASMMLSGLVRLSWNRLIRLPYEVDDGCTPLVALFQVIAGDVTWMMTQIATLNLIIHVWYTLRSIESPSPSRRVENRRQVLFLVTPYCFGLFPLIELIPTYEFSLVVTVNAIVEALLITVTSVWDILILASFIRRKRNYDKLRMGHLLSTRLLAKILVFSGYRLSLTILNLISGLFRWSSSISDAVILGRGLFPLLVFVLLGLRKDVFEVWFPGLFNIRPDESSTLDPKIFP